MNRVLAALPGFIAAVVFVGVLWLVTTVLPAIIESGVWKEWTL